jgi:hypothetical protein
MTCKSSGYSGRNLSFSRGALRQEFGSVSVICVDGSSACSLVFSVGSVRSHPEYSPRLASVAIRCFMTGDYFDRTLMWTHPLTRKLQRRNPMSDTKNCDKAADSGLPSHALFGFLLSLVRYPFAQKCRHAVAMDILSIMEDHGVGLPQGLTEAICKSSGGDQDAEQILLGILEPNSVRSRSRGLISKLRLR